MDALIRERLLIDPTSPTGLRWRKRYNNRTRPDLVAFPSVRKGYYVGRLGGQNLEAHRVVFFLHNGYWPDLIDHWDRNKQNNHPDNLRDRSVQDNNQNVIGRGWVRHQGRYQAQITVSGKVLYLGMYDTPEAAHEAYLIAKAVYHTTNL
jgi:hypothetical protein